MRQEAKGQVTNHEIVNTPCMFIYRANKRCGGRFTLTVS